MMLNVSCDEQLFSYSAVLGFVDTAKLTNMVECPKAWFPYNRPNCPNLFSCLKIDSGNLGDYMETLKKVLSGRSLMPGSLVVLS